MKALACAAVYFVGMLVAIVLLVIMHAPWQPQHWADYMMLGVAGVLWPVIVLVGAPLYLLYLVGMLGMWVAGLL